MKSTFSWQFQEDELIEASTVSLWDRGFRYGMSVFETLLVHRGKIVFEAEHISRLHEAASAAGFSVPSRLAEVLRSKFADVDESFTCMVRVYLTAGEGGPSGRVDRIVRLHFR